MYTFQDFEKAADRIAFIRQAIDAHRNSVEYRIATEADLYDRQQNVTVNAFSKQIFSSGGRKIIDPTASNNRIASNFFHRLLSQRVTYSLGNGISFTEHIRRDVDANGNTISIDETKERLGNDFDTTLYFTAYAAERDGKAYALLNYDSKDGYTLHLFPMTQFVPLVDEFDGALRAGIRFWSLEWGKRPVTAVLYEEDGYTTYRTRENSAGLDLIEYVPKRAYKQIVQHTDAAGDVIVGDENYSAGLPVIPLYGKNRQSALIGIRAAIDSYDLIQSGFANDISDCAQIYWIIGNALGMDETDIQKFRERLLFQHVAVADTDNSSVTPHTQEIPYAAREAYLTRIADRIYKDFGAFNPETVAAANVTATQIKAAYQTQDEEADDFEYRCIQFIRRMLELMGIDDMPQFKRNMIANQSEQVQMIMMEAQYLDDETLLNLLPNITPDMVPEILARRDAQDASKWSQTAFEPEEEETPAETQEA